MDKKDSEEEKVLLIWQHFFFFLLVVADSDNENVYKYMRWRTIPMVNYFIDSENVGFTWLDPIFKELKGNDRIFLFYTDNSPKIPYEKLEQLSSVMKQIHIVYCYEGPNALDFQLCTYLGYLMKSGPKSEYIIVSNDHGYDAVVQFWKSKDKIVKRTALSGSDKKEKTAAYHEKPVIECIQSTYQADFAVLLNMKQSSAIYKKIYAIISGCKSLNGAYQGLIGQFGNNNGASYYKKIRKLLKQYYIEKSAAA